MIDDEAEATLVALADPIVWQLILDRKDKGHWQGTYKDTVYRLVEPLTKAIDVPTVSRLWRIIVQPDGARVYHICHVATLKEAKALCLRHALSGDLSEVKALVEAEEGRGARFHQYDSAATERLGKCFPPGHDIEMLPCTPPASSERKALTFVLIGQGGHYEARWEPERRWSVTFHAEDDAPPLDKRFLTRRQVRLACALHSRNGRWVGMLPDEAKV